MIPQADARQAIALAGQGAHVSEIARRLGHDRKTIRIYLNGHRAPASRARTRTPSPRSPPTSGSAPAMTSICAGPGCTARSPPWATPAATPRSPANSAATASPSPAAPASPGSPSPPPANSGPQPFRSAPRRWRARRSPLTWPGRQPRTTSRSARSPMSCRHGSPSGPPPATTSPNRDCCSPVTPGAWPRSPASPKPRSGTRSPHSPGTVTTGARPSASPSPAGTAPPGTDTTTRFPFTSRHTAEHANGTAPGSAAPPRSASQPPRRSSAQAGRPPASPASTASPG